MTKAIIFRTGDTQVIRLPEALAFPPHIKQVELVRNGQTLIITPPGRPWDDFFDTPGVSPDFLTER